MKLTAVSRRTLGLIAVVIPIVVLFIYVVIRSGPMAPVSVTTASVTMREKASDNASGSRKGGGKKAPRKPG